MTFQEPKLPFRERLFCWLKGNLQIYTEQMPYSQMEKLVWKIGNAYWCKLTGVNFSLRDNLIVEPVYCPLVKIETGDGFIAIELHFWRIKSMTVFLYDRPPFIYFVKTNYVTLEKEE